MPFIPVMNQTKWEELRLAMYQLGELTPRWRRCDVDNGFISRWDKEWFYHFRERGYETIEWIEIQIESQEQDRAVHPALRKIHLPGENLGNGYRVYGFIPIDKAIEYL